MATVVFENIVNRERVVCNDVKHVHIVDGVEYLTVYRGYNPQPVLMRKDALRKIKEPKRS